MKKRNCSDELKSDKIQNFPDIGGLEPQIFILPANQNLHKQLKEKI